MIAHVVLGASDPENATLGQRKQMLEVDVGLVKHRDLSGRQPGAQGDHAATVVVGAFFNYGKGRQEGLQVQAQVQLGRRFAPPVPGPVHTVGNQGDGGGVDAVDGLFETPGQPLVAS